jgi:hypothetical protein
MYASISRYLNYNDDDEINSDNTHSMNSSMNSIPTKMKENFVKNKPPIQRPSGPIQTPSGPIQRPSGPIQRPINRPETRRMDRPGTISRKSLKEMITGQKEEYDNITIIEKNNDSDLNLNWKEEQGLSTNNPRVWGPAFWFTLHTSAMYYPENASPIVKERMKNRILAIPYELPCSSCRQHAIAFIESNRDKLDDIVSSNDKLFRFYVDFHNQVNARYGKREWTYDEARAAYSGQATLRYLNY